MTAGAFPSTEDAPAGRASASRVFRGWYVVAGVFVMLTVAAGIGFYGLSVYLRALTVEQEFSVGSVSAATALFFVVAGVVGLPVASWTARRDPRPLVAAGAVACAVSLLLLGRLTEQWQLYGVYALFGAGFSASSLVPGTTLVTRWFARRRSVALSVATTGLSAGGVLLTPLVAALVERHGLGAVTPWLAVAFVVGIVPVTALLLHPSPQALGLQPDGDPVPAADAPPAPLGATADAAVRTRYFVAVTAAHLLAMAAQVGGMAHVYNLVAERQDAALAATAVSVLAGSSLVGRLVGGVVAARVSMRGMAVALMAVQGSALLLLSLSSSAPALLAAVCLFGLTVGNLLMLHPLLLAERFGVRDYPRIYSRSQLAATLGIAAGPAVTGVLHDGLDGYGAAFALIAAASVLAGCVLATSGPTRAPVRGSAP
ncbi:MAG TPA: MFS transporter [Mycobacteriales bacterium]|nr:MFS transporter [Mycobacteriales bacterium]